MNHFLCFSASFSDGGNNSSFLPPFANAENRALDAKIRELEKNLEREEAGLEESGDRMLVMSEHLKNVRQEIQYTQSRLEAKDKELTTEDHLKILLLNECGRLKTDIAKLEEEKKAASTRAINIQLQIERGNDTMDQFKMKMNWNQEELESWALAGRQKEEDLEALAKYGRVDDGKLRDLALALEKVAKDITETKAKLNDEITETQSAQIQLDKTAEDFKALHEERLELVRQWEDALETVKHRDVAIQAASERFATLKAALREAKSDLAEQEKFLKAEQANNRELDFNITVADREVANQREIYGRETTKTDRAVDSLGILNSSLGRLRSDLMKQRAVNDNLRNELSHKERKLMEASAKLSKESEQLEKEMNKLTSAEEKLDALSELIKEEDERYKIALKETEALRGVIFKRSEALKQCRDREKDLISEIQGGQTQLRNLDARVASLESQVIKQEELIYNADFQIQLMERKVARASGERSDEEKRILNEKIGAMTKELEGINAEHSMLVGQVKHAEQDLITAKRKHVNLKESSHKMTEQLSELMLEIEETTRAVKATIKDKEERMVAHDVMRLEAKRLRELLGSRADEVFSLENKKTQLKLSLEERRQEVDVHMDALKAELRLAEDDRHQLTLELKERESRVEKLEAKYSVLERKGKGTDENGEEVGQAYYVIKAAADREDLQREGDDLDLKIQKAEKEVRALEATLSKLNGTNNAFRGTLRKGDHAETIKQNTELRSRLDACYDRLKLKRSAEKELARDTIELEEGLSQLKEDESRLSQAITEMGREKMETDALIADQKEKAMRANRRLQSLMREAVALAGGRGEEAGGAGGAQSPLEMDVELTDKKELNRAILQELKALAQQHPRSGIIDQLQVANVMLGGASVGGSSRGTSRAGSRPSTRSQLRSQQGSRGAPVSVTNIGF